MTKKEKAALLGEVHLAALEAQGWILDNALSEARSNEQKFALAHAQWRAGMAAEFGIDNADIINSVKTGESDAVVIWNKNPASPMFHGNPPKLPQGNSGKSQQTKGVTTMTNEKRVSLLDITTHYCQFYITLRTKGRTIGASNSLCATHEACERAIRVGIDAEEVENALNAGYERAMSKLAQGGRPDEDRR
jgi:hypothetical protein